MTAITYRLPVSELVITGTARTSTDAFAEKPSTTLEGVDFKVVTSADLATQCTVDPPTGMWTTYKGSFGVMTDGRLSSASADVTGEVGAALKSVATIAGAVVALTVLDVAARPVDDADNTRITDAYRGAYEDEYDRFMSLRQARTKIRTKLAAALGAAADDDADATDLRRLRATLAVVEEQLAPVELHFRTWRASKVTTTATHFELRVPVAEIPTTMPDAVWGKGRSDETGGVPADLEQLWKRYGVGVQAVWLAYAPNARPTAANAPGTATSFVYARRPEPLELRFLQQSGDAVVETDRRRQFVADKFSVIDRYELKKSRLGRKSLALTFDADGFVTTVATEGSSAAAAGLAAVAALPEGFAGGVESGTKAYTNVQTARRAAVEAEAAHLKAEVDKRQQKLLSQGLDATAGDAVELQRLQQLEGILDAQSKIQGADPSLVAALAARADGDLSWYHQPPPAPPPEPQVVKVVFGDGPADGPPPPAPPKAPPGTGRES